MESSRAQIGRNILPTGLDRLEAIMTYTLENNGANTPTRRGSVCDASPKGAVDVGKVSGAHDDAEEAYPAELMPDG